MIEGLGIDIEGTIMKGAAVKNTMEEKVVLEGAEAGVGAEVEASTSTEGTIIIILVPLEMKARKRHLRPVI